MIRLVIFDNNGTIYDDLDVAYGSATEIFKTYSIPSPTKDQYRSGMTANFMKFYHDHGFPNCSSGDEENKLASDLNRIRASYYKEHGDRAVFRPDVAKTIFELKTMGIQTAIVSAETDLLLSRELHRFGYDGVFKPVISDVRNKQVCLTDLCRELGVNANSAIYVDDTVDGTSAAKRAGLIPVGVIADNAYNSPDRLKEVTLLLVRNLYEVVGIARNFRTEVWR